MNTHTALPLSRDYLIGFEPDIISAAGVRRFHDYWLALRGARRFPTKAEFDITAIPSLASNLLLLNVYYDPLDFEYRIIGEDIAIRFKNLKGRRVREAVLVNVGKSAYLNYCAVVETGRPQFMEGWITLTDRGDQPCHLSRVHCPLSTDGETIDHIVSCIAFAYLPASCRMIDSNQN